VFRLIDHLKGLAARRPLARPLRPPVPHRRHRAADHRAGGFPDRRGAGLPHSQQLRQFGADAYIVNILGISLIRELGPMLGAILIAGRSGSAITAQIGVMRVTDELDAMRVMGISHGYRLVMPRALALAIAMP
jgi:hypothetical protein